MRFNFHATGPGRGVLELDDGFAGGAAGGCIAVWTVITLPFVLLAYLGSFAFVVAIGWLGGDWEAIFMGLGPLIAFGSIVVIPMTTLLLNQRQLRGMPSSPDPGGRRQVLGTVAMSLGIANYFVCLVASPIVWLLGSMATREIASQPKHFSNLRTANAARLLGLQLTVHAVGLGLLLVIGWVGQDLLGFGMYREEIANW